MSKKSQFSARATGIAVTDPNRVLGVASFGVAFFVPIVALPMAIIALRRSAVLGDDNYWALLGRNVSIFFLSLYVAICAIGLTITVIVPSLTHR